LRDRSSSNLQIKITSSPNGFNHLYDQFAGKRKTKYNRLISATAYDNPHLPEGYIDSLAQQYDDLMFRQEVMGEFVEATAGRVYDAFTRKNHLSKKNNLNNYMPVGGCDFNVSPIAGVCCYVSDEGIYVYDELWAYNSSTFALTEMFKRADRSIVDIVPDATGARRTTNSGKSDHHIIRDAGFNVLTKGFNPNRRDRFNAVNALFHQKKLIIHPRCEHLIQDLENYSHDPKANHEDLGHITDALGYVVWHFFPLKRHIAAPSTRQL